MDLDNKLDFKKKYLKMLIFLINEIICNTLTMGAAKKNLY
jgi:hypothetical protein